MTLTGRTEDSSPARDALHSVLVGPMKTPSTLDALSVKRDGADGYFRHFERFSLG